MAVVGSDVLMFAASLGGEENTDTLERKARGVGMGSHLQTSSWQQMNVANLGNTAVGWKVLRSHFIEERHSSQVCCW